MTDKEASFMCNQVLRVVKESQLNYLVNETPYSAHVTIRKKFVKYRESEGTFAVNDFPLSDLALRQENISLLQKSKGLESDNGASKLKIEELELKLEEVTKSNSKLEEKLAHFETEEKWKMKMH